ncbi:MAG: MFS transporter [Bryobacteraceae bacterium]
MSAISEATQEYGLQINDVHSEVHSAVGLRPYSRVFAVSLCGALAFLDLYCTQPLLPMLSKAFHASETKVSLTVSAATLGVAVTAVLLSMFGERLDRKRTIIGAASALAVVTALAATAPTLHALILWRLLQGLLTPCIFIITIAYVTEEWPAHLVPRVMSLYVAGTVFGGFTGRIVGGELTEHFGWRLMFVVLALMGVAGTAFAHRLLRPSRPREHVSRPHLAPMLDNLRNPRLLVTFGIGFCVLFMQVSLFSYITFYLAAAPFDLSTAELAWIFAVYLVGLIATLAAGTMLARIGLLKGILGAIALCLFGTMLTLVPSLAIIGIGLSVASSGVFISQTCTNSFFRDAAPRGSRVSAAALYTCIYYAGGTLGGILPGLIWKYAAWPGCVGLICVFLIAAGALAYFGWRSPRKAVA